jgi:hypothetical protein
MTASIRKGRHLVTMDFEAVPVILAPIIAAATSSKALGP